MTYIGSWADLKYTVPADHKMAEAEKSLERETSFSEPVALRPAEFRALHGRPNVYESGADLWS